MTASRIFILTTEGPVGIQRIFAENLGLNSVICLDGRAETLPVSKSYHAFVHQPVGVIERLTGHGAYRMDVDGRIDDGRSWQLAAFIAHIAVHTDTTPDKTVFATGEIDNELFVRPVEQVSEKLQRFAEYLADSGINPADAIILVPRGAGDDLERVAGVPVRSVATASDALRALGMEMPEQKQARIMESQGGMAAPKIKTGYLRVVALARAVAVGLFWFGSDLSRWAALSKQGRLLELEEELAHAEGSTLGNIRGSIYRHWLALQLPPENIVSFDGKLKVVTRDQNCGDGETVLLSVRDALDSEINVCELEMTAFASVPDWSIVGRMAYWPNGLGSSDKPARTMRGSASSTQRTWKIEFNTKSISGALVRAVAVIGKSEVWGAQPWYGPLLSAPVDSGGFQNAIQRLKRLGYRVEIASWSRE